MTQHFHLGGLAAAFLAGASVWAGTVEVRYVYGLSDLAGPVRMLGGRLQVDTRNNEVLLADGNTVHIFNASGMETYQFTLDPNLGQLFDLAVDDAGDFLLGCVDPGPEAGSPTFVIHRCDYRGRLKSTIVPSLPEAHVGFAPTAMRLREGRLLYLLSHGQLEAMVLRIDGGFVRHIDLAPLLGVEEEERGNLEIGGFGFSAAGDMIVTVPEHFRATILAPDWTVRGAFGRKGSGPGRFGVVAGVEGDDIGNLFIADKGRSVVLVFDKNFKFVTEFGHYGDQPENLVRPEQLAWLPPGRLLVTQMKHRGVSVFDVAAR